MTAPTMDSFWSGKQVVVTGGAGFIGSYTVELLLEAGASVRVPIRDPDNAGHLSKPILAEIELLTADLADEPSCMRVVEGADIVLNLAADVGGIDYNMRHPASIFRNNTTAFMNVLEAARVCEVERFLAVSSACVYARECPIPTPETEGFEGVPEPTNGGYGWAKRMQEYLADAYHQQYGMRIAIARPYNAYGPRDNFDPAASHVISALIRRVCEGENPLAVWGDGKQSRSFLYAEDFARGLLLTAEQYAESDVLNIGSDEEVTIGELVELIVDLSGAELTIDFDTSKPVGQLRRCCDTRKAAEKIGFAARTPLADGLRRTIDYYRSIAS